MSYDLYRYCHFYSACDYGDAFYVPAIMQNGIYKIEKKTWEINKVLDFEVSGEQYIEGLYTYCALVGDKIVFCPQNTNQVAIYDILKNECVTLDIIVEGDKHSFFGTIGHAVNNDKVYIYSTYDEKAPLILDLKNYEIQYDMRWKEKVSKVYASGQTYFISSIAQIHEIVWTGIYKTNKVIGYCLNQNKVIKEYKLDSDFQIERIFKAVDEKLFITSLDGGKICVLDMVTEEQSYYILPNKFKVAKILFKDRICMISYNEKKIIVADGNMENIKVIDLDIPEFFSFHATRFYYAGCIFEGVLYLYPFRSNGIVTYEFSTGKVGFKSTLLNEEISEILRNIRKRSYDKLQSYNENIYPLKDFISDIKCDVKRDLSNISCGKLIYEESLDVY